MAHLDHYRAGAMDNASGCSVLMEAAEALSRLINDGALPRPRRAIRFLFGPEGHTSNVYPHSLGDRLDRIIGSWTVDQVGARPDQVGGALIFTRASAATPTFLSDLGPGLLKESCSWYPGMDDSPVATGAAPDTVIHTRPGTSPFKFDTIPYGIHSDNACIGGWSVPAVGIFQWPATPWHTQFDTPERLDAQELARCAWATAAASYRVAAAGPREALEFMHAVFAGATRRMAAVSRRAREQPEAQIEQAVDELRYCVERDTEAIASCLSLARAEAALDDAQQRLGNALRRHLEFEIDLLRDYFGAARTFFA
jgi:hypothetical protein